MDSTLRHSLLQLRNSVWLTQMLLAVPTTSLLIYLVCFSFAFCVVSAFSFAPNFVMSFPVGARSLSVFCLLPEGSSPYSMPVAVCLCSPLIQFIVCIVFCGTLEMQQANCDELAPGCHGPSRRPPCAPLAHGLAAVPARVAQCPPPADPRPCRHGNVGRGDVRAQCQPLSVRVECRPRALRHRES